VSVVERPEVVVEGTTDGSAWFEIEFLYKPGRVDRLVDITIFLLLAYDRFLFGLCVKWSFVSATLFFIVFVFAPVIIVSRFWFVRTSVVWRGSAVLLLLLQRLSICCCSVCPSVAVGPT
jgi:hypothetical protein